jgi:hypothetical protein
MEYYTYIYYDPSRNNEPIYVGKGHKLRAWRHLTLKGNGPFTCRLKHMKKNNVKPVIGIYSGFDEELALLVEVELIAKFGRKDLGRGPLLNLTDGGEGTKGNTGKQAWNKNIPMAEETKEKLSKANKGKKHIFTEEHRKKLSESRKNKPWSVEQRKVHMAERALRHRGEII